MGPEPGSYQVTARQAAFAQATSISSRRIILRATSRSGLGSDPSRGGPGHYRSQVMKGLTLTTKEQARLHILNGVLEGHWLV